MRFSQVAIPRDGSDICRDLCGFSVKFYTEDGNVVLRISYSPDRMLQPRVF